MPNRYKHHVITTKILKNEKKILLDLNSIQHFLHFSCVLKKENTLGQLTFFLSSRILQGFALMQYHYF